MRLRRITHVLVLLALFAGVAGCAHTKYHGTPVASLSDEQLVQELESAVHGAKVSINRTQLILAMRPEPAYVLTSSASTFSGTLNATYNAFSMPVGYGVSTRGHVSGRVQGTSSTQYHYTDANAGAALGYAIVAAISAGQARAYRKRGEEVWAEFQRRAETSRAEAETLIQDFFKAYPELQAKRTLVAVVLPWAAAEGIQDGRQTLERSGEIIGGLRRGSGLSGTWYGIFSQTTRLSEDRTVAFNQFMQIELAEQSGKVTGTGKLGSGELLELSGTVTGQHIEGVVANTTSAINVSYAGIAAESQITGEYVGGGAGRQVTGTVVLLR